MSKKKKNILLMIGLVSLLLAGISFGASHNLEDYNVSAGGAYPIGTITAADLSMDEATTVIVDNFETVLLLDDYTKEIKWIKSTRDICDGYAQIWKAVFDEQKQVYVHIKQFDANFSFIEKEYICKFDSTGKEIARFDIPGLSEMSTNSPIRGFKCQDDFLYYYNENTQQLVRMNVETGSVEEYGNYDTQMINDSFTLGFTEDDTVALAYTDGTLALGYADGTTKNIGRINYHLQEEGFDTIVNQHLYLNGKDYVTDGRYFDAIYEVKDGQLEMVNDISNMLNLDVLLVDDYYEYALNSGISAYNNGNGKVLLTFSDHLFYTTDMETFYGMDAADTYKLPAAVSGKGFIKFLAGYLQYVFGLLALIFIGGSIMKWRFSLRSKLFFIIIPLTMGAIVLITYYEMNTIEKDFKDQLYEEYDAISSFYRNQIDSELICSVESLDDADKLEQVRLALMDNIEEGSKWADNVDINVYRYFDNNVHLLLYSSTMESLYGASSMFNFEQMEPDRLPDSDTYHHETRGIATTYLDSITYLRDENNEIYGFIDVYGNLDKLKISENQMKRKVLIITVVFGLILGALLYIIAHYIIRHLRMTSKTIGLIADGNFKARVEKITKDELGVISGGVNDMASQIETLFADQEEFSRQVIETLVGTIDAKDNYTNGHSIRVAKYSKMIAEKLGKSEEECKQVYYVGLLHDIGKIGIPDEIINKTSRLTDEEFAIIKTHPDKGNKMLSNLTKIENVSIGAHFHHERYDGKGYPQGLKGEEIPEIARIIAVADTYDAMTSNRSYRKAMTQEKVRGELEKGKGSQFDPLFADKMLEIDKEIEELIYENTFSLN